MKSVNTTHIYNIRYYVCMCIRTFPSHKTTDHNDKEKQQYNNHSNDCSYYYVDTIVTYTCTQNEYSYSMNAAIQFT